MSRLSLRLPESGHRKVRELAEREDVSINQFVATAVAEWKSAPRTVEYLEQRAERGSWSQSVSLRGWHNGSESSRRGAGSD